MDPDRCVREIYEYASVPLSQGSFDRMREWTQANPQNKYGTRRYSLDQYGLTPEGIRATFSEYEAFNVELEARWGF